MTTSLIRLLTIFPRADYRSTIIEKMARIKIKVNTSVLQQRTKSMNIIIGSGTTAHSVVCKVLDKCNSRDAPGRLQLWAVMSRGATHQQNGESSTYSTHNDDVGFFKL